MPTPLSTHAYNLIDEIAFYEGDEGDRADGEFRIRYKGQQKGGDIQKCCVIPPAGLQFAYIDLQAVHLSAELTKPKNPTYRYY